MAPSPSTPRAVVVYESMFGNTATIAAAVAQGLQQDGVEATCTDVRDADHEVALTADLLVLGAPTHAFSLSRPGTRAGAVREGAAADRAATGLREWIAAATPRSPGLVVAAFDTRVGKVRRLPAGAAPAAARLARRRGFRVATKPRTFVVEDTHGPLQDGEVAQAFAWGRELAALTAECGRAPARARQEGSDR